MNGTDLAIYRQEIQRLLMSMSIKYTPISDLYNQKITLQGHEVDESDPLSWKYYMNLQGDYHFTDTVMMIRSLDTSETVPFTKETLRNHRATRRAYVPGNPFYTALVDRYPEQADLIKSIVYPVIDIELMLEAPDLTLLQYDRTILEQLEQTILIQDLVRHLDYIRDRWYQRFLDVEIFYPMAFWGSLWQNLTGALFTFRTSYIQTSFAHDFHIKAFLESRGIDVLQGILKRDQVLFLYRNIDYILNNRGKQETLNILARNLLTEDALGLVNKTISQNITDSEQNACRWIPEFVSRVIPSNYQKLPISLPIETVRDMNQKLVNAGLDTDTSDDHIARQTRRMGATIFNKLPTKILELKKFDQSCTKERLIWNFMMDTFMYSLIQNHHTPTHRIQDRVTGIVLQLNGLDTVFLLQYAIGRILDRTAKTLPKQYSPKFIYKDTVTEDMIPTTFYFHGYAYPMKQFVDVPEWIINIDYPDTPISDSARFVDHMAVMFDQFLYQYQLSQTTSSMLTQQAYHTAFNAITKTENIPLVSETIAYNDWIDATPNLRIIIDTFESSSKAQEFYAVLAEDIFDNLLPTTEAISAYLDLNRDIEKYRLLTDIFRQLTSYNVAFLNSNREDQIWAPLTKTSYFVHGVTHTHTDYMRSDIPVTYRDDTHHKLRYRLSDKNLFLDPHLCIDIAHTTLVPYMWASLPHTHHLYDPPGDIIEPTHHHAAPMTYPTGVGLSIDMDTSAP